MTFFVDRWNGQRWTTIAAAEHYINPASIHGPSQSPNAQHLPAHQPENATAFAGLDGWSARVRFNRKTMEEYLWQRRESDQLWDWVLAARYPVDIGPDQTAACELSVM